MKPAFPLSEWQLINVTLHEDVGRIVIRTGAIETRVSIDVQSAVVTRVIDSLAVSVSGSEKETVRKAAIELHLERVIIGIRRKVVVEDGRLDAEPLVKRLAR